MVYSVWFIARITKGRAEVTPLQAIATLPIIMGYMGAALSLGVGASQRWWKNLVDAKPRMIWCMPALLWCLYAVYAIPTGQFELKYGLALAVYLALPVYLASRKRIWADWLIVLVVALPLIEKDMLVLARIPAEKGVNPREICSVTTFLWSMLIVRRLPGLDFRLRLPVTELKYGLRMFAWAMLLMLPAGVLTGFLKWNPFQLQQSLYHTNALGVIIGVHLLLPLGMYLAVAIPEELVFRGTLQNLLAQTTKRPWLALVIVSLLFGISHVGSNVDGRPFIYSVGYALMSAVAGGIYGYAYMKRGGIAAACVVHALVDTTWLTLFNPK